MAPVATVEKQASKWIINPLTQARNRRDTPPPNNNNNHHQYPIKTQAIDGWFFMAGNED